MIDTQLPPRFFHKSNQGFFSIPFLRVRSHSQWIAAVLCARASQPILRGVICYLSVGHQLGFFGHQFVVAT